MKEKGKTKSEKVRMSLLFTFSLLFSTFTAGTALAAGGTKTESLPGVGGTLYGDRVYVVNSDTTLSGRAGQSALSVASGEAAVIYIASNCTLTCIGGNGSGTTPGGAGISVPATSKLIVVGDGTLKATGGNAASGVSGSDGGDGAIYYSENRGIGGFGGAGGASSMVVYLGLPYSVSVPTLSGYTFTGYYTATSGGTQVFDANGNCSRWDLIGDYTLYAQWTGNPRTVTLDLAGGSGVTSMGVTYGQIPAKIALPTKTGLKFVGLFTEAGGAGTQVFDEYGIAAEPWLVDADMTLYAFWVNELCVTGSLDLSYDLRSVKPAQVFKPEMLTSSPTGWEADAETAAIFEAIGEGSPVVVVAPLAKGGKCPEIVFEIDAAYAATFAGGDFALYLLDTRVRDADGKVALASESGGEGTRRPTTVNAAGIAVVGNATLNSSLSTFNSASAVALADVGVYAKIDEPRIDAMRIAGAKIELTVSGMSDAAEYMVVQGSEPGKVGAKMETKVVGDKLIVDKPVGGAMFFRVLGTRRFR